MARAASISVRATLIYRYEALLVRGPSRSAVSLPLLTHRQDHCNASTIGIGYHGGHREGANAERAENSRKLPGGQLIFGVQSWHCVDSPDVPWAKEIAPFDSLLDACQGAIQCKEMNQLQPLNVVSACVFCIFLFRELITTIDDKVKRSPRNPCFAITLT